MDPFNRVAIYERAKSMTLNADDIVALAQVALQTLDRNRQLLSSCQSCGAPKKYDSDQGYYYEHNSGCPVGIIEAIDDLPIEADDD